MQENKSLRKDKNTTVSTNQTQKTKQQKVKEKHRVQYTREENEHKWTQKKGGKTDKDQKWNVKHGTRI